MDRQSIAEQLDIEQQLITNTVASLRAALDWKAEDRGTARKLSTIRFVSDVLRRHLARLMAIHEFDGYMPQISQSHARLIPAVQRLREEQKEIRDELNRLVPHLERLSPQEAPALEDVYNAMREVLTIYEQHSHRQSILIQEAYSQDVGGEG